jgi:hypothetical protein
MAVFGFNEAWTAVALAAFNAGLLVHLDVAPPAKRHWFHKPEHLPDWAMAAWWLYHCVWVLVAAMLTVAMYYFFSNTPADSWQLIVGFTFAVIHVVTLRGWQQLFWRKAGSPELALNVLVWGGLGSGTVWLVAMAVNQVGLFWVPVMLLAMEMAWLLYLTAVNAAWVNHVRAMHAR